MQEFSSVTASSYDAESLAPMLTEKAQEGWSVVSIVSAGTNVVAYLTRGADAAPAVTEPDTAALDADTDDSDGGAVPVAAAAAVGGVAAGAAVASATDDWSTDTDDAAAYSADVADDVTAISPTLPDEVSTPEVPEAEASPEAAAAVEASGEPAGWGAAPAEPTIPEATPAVSDDEDSNLGAVAGGVGLAAGAAAVGGAAIAGDAASDVTGDLADSAGDAVGGMADTATDAGMTDIVDDAAAVEATSAADTEAADTAAAATDDAASGVPAGWYADPSGRFELRYWDGNAWTEHVSRAGQQYTDPPVA